MRKIISLFKSNFNFTASVIILLTLGLYGLLINNINLWLDEIYSVLMAKDNFHDMWILLSTEDSKPPLYYLYLKFVLMLFPKIYEIWGAHFSSCILLIVAQVFAATRVKKDFGESVALWLILILMLMPASLWLAFEVRTYMLSGLLMMMALVYGISLIYKQVWEDFIKFGIVSLLALYSHYYCALWLCFLYAFILLSMLKNKNDRHHLRYFLLTAVTVGILFAPWLYVPLNTGQQISGKWYLHDGFVKFSWQFFTNPLNPEIFQSVYFIATTFASSVFSFMLILGVCTQFSTKESGKLFKLGFYSFALTYLLLIILSYVVRPVVSARYLKIFSPVLYLCVAVVLTQFPKLRIPFLIAGVIGFVFTYADVRSVTFDNGYQIAVHNIRQFISKDKILLTYDNSNLFCEYYLPEYKCILITDGKGEILRKPQVLKNMPLYHHLPDENINFSLSIYSHPNNPNQCIPYLSNYRYGQNVTLCQHNFDEAKQAYQNSLYALEHLDSTPVD